MYHIYEGFVRIQHHSILCYLKSMEIAAFPHFTAFPEVILRFAEIVSCEYESTDQRCNSSLVCKLFFPNVGGFELNPSFLMANFNILHYK